MGEGREQDGPGVVLDAGERPPWSVVLRYVDRRGNAWAIPTLTPADTREDCPAALPQGGAIGRLLRWAFGSRARSSEEVRYYRRVVRVFTSAEYRAVVRRMDSSAVTMLGTQLGAAARHWYGEVERTAARKMADAMSAATTAPDVAPDDDEPGRDEAAGGVFASHDPLRKPSERAHKVPLVPGGRLPQGFGGHLVGRARSEAIERGEIPDEPVRISGTPKRRATPEAPANATRTPADAAVNVDGGGI